MLGRTLTAAEEQPGRGDVVVIGHAAWEQYFAGDRDVVGREVQLGSTRAIFSKLTRYERLSGPASGA